MNNCQLAKQFLDDNVLIITTNNIKIKGTFKGCDDKDIFLLNTKAYSVDAGFHRVPNSKSYSNGNMTVPRCNVAMILRYNN